MGPDTLSRGRIIVPGTQHQLGACGLFPPSSVQRKSVTAGNHTVDAKACTPGLLWVSFAELCAPGVTRGVARALADEPELWVVDGMPAPGTPSGGLMARAWERFADVLRELAARDVTLFLVARETPDWAGAAEEAQDPALRKALIEAAFRLAALPRMESDERLTVEGISGS